MPFSINKSVIALLGGVFYPFAFAPYGWWPLVIVAIALLYLSAHGASIRQAAWRGWLFGLASFGIGVSWLHVSMYQYGGTPLWLAVPMTGLFAAVLALFPALLAGLSIRLGHSGAVFAGLWLLTDWLRGWLLTGFPWLYPGYALIDTPLAGLAPLGGIWLMTLATVVSAMVLTQLPGLRRRWQPVSSGLALLLWLLALPSWQFTAPGGEPVNVAMAQGNVPQDIRWQLTQQAATRDIYARLSSQVPDNTLLIWPEAAITEFYQDADAFLDQQGTLLAERQGALISGIPWRADDGDRYRYYNSVTVLDGGSGLYHKQKLVPFGEYVPLQGLIRGLIPFFDLPMSSFSRGDPEQDNLQAMGITVAPFICYEILYPSLVAARSQRSDVLLTISNDAWFGTSAGPHQHFQMARLRARETGRYLLRATNNGITAIVGPNGQIIERLPQFQRALLQGQVQPMQGNTPFMLSGPTPVLLLALALVALGRRWPASKALQVNQNEPL